MKGYCAGAIFGNHDGCLPRRFILWYRFDSVGPWLAGVKSLFLTEANYGISRGYNPMMIIAVAGYYPDSLRDVLECRKLTKQFDLNMRYRR